VRTISRYETGFPPQGKVLRSFIALTRLNDLKELEGFFLTVIANEIEENYGVKASASIDFLNMELFESPKLFGKKQMVTTEMLAAFETLLNDWRHLHAKGVWQDYADARLARHHEEDMKRFEELLRTKKEGRQDDREG
jgi:hypothetical protein